MIIGIAILEGRYFRKIGGGRFGPMRGGTINFSVEWMDILIP